MLVHYLESFTDSLLITDEKGNPIGIVGGLEIIKNVFEDPHEHLFEKTVGEIMSTEELLKITPRTRFKDLIETWKQTRRAYSIMKNQYGWYSAISARKILEIGANSKTGLTVADLPRKKIITFSYDDTFGKIINLMLTNRTRKLLFKNTSGFISDRIIIQKIAQELRYLKDVENFLDIKFEEPFKLADATSVSENMNLADLSKMMFGMLHPYVMTKDQVYSPWDVCLALLSDGVK
ncbi:MAG TPA: CBS domain-containing protein [Candidatus Nitrosotenuis sp.]|nr:CBS domain-containing protein [Candidatus Nitrosotenuis sp.]